jgi:hypothetical protein
MLSCGPAPTGPERDGDWENNGVMARFSRAIHVFAVGRADT